MGLREKQPRDEEKRFRNISLPRVIPHSGCRDGERSLSVFPGGRVEAARARKHSSCEDALLLNLMITGEEDEAGRARGLTALRYRRPRDLAGFLIESQCIHDVICFPLHTWGKLHCRCTEASGASVA